MPARVVGKAGEHLWVPLRQPPRFRCIVTEVIGFAAGVLTTVAFVPQVLKTWRSRSSADLSSTMLAVFAAGLMLWLVYGIVRSSWPIILANAATLWLVCFLLILKLQDRRLS
jgi:MtN3 and saliva related transmembrane protein